MARTMVVAIPALAAAVAAALLVTRPMEPPAGAVGPTDKTLAEIEPRTPIGPATTSGDAGSLYPITLPVSYDLAGHVQTESGQRGIEAETAGVSVAGVNSGPGIHAPIGGDDIQGNDIRVNMIGIDADRAADRIARNTAKGNTANFAATGAQTIGPIIAATGALSSTSPWANFPY